MSGLSLALVLFLCTFAFSIDTPPVPDEKGRDIGLSEAVTLHKQKILFVDARSEDDFKEGHIKGAVSLSVQTFDDKIEKFRKCYPDTIPLVLYCSGRECSDSHDLADMFYRKGYFNIRIFVDGYPAWEAAGLPVDTLIKLKR